MSGAPYYQPLLNQKIFDINALTAISAEAGTSQCWFLKLVVVGELECSGVYLLHSVRNYKKIFCIFWGGYKELETT